MTSRQGSLLENNVSSIFKQAGFDTEVGKRKSGYEIDVFATFGDKNIIIECKQYEKSHLIVRNLIHEWAGKNRQIKADKVLLVVYGVNIKNDDRRLAREYDIDIWNEDDVNSYLKLMLDREKIKKVLLDFLKFKRRPLHEVYDLGLKKLVWYPILSDNKLEENNVYDFLLKSLKISVRTVLRERRNTTAEERKNHIDLFENIEIKKKQLLWTVTKSDYTTKEEWNKIKDKLRSNKTLPKGSIEYYLKFVSEIENGFENSIKWFDGDNETVKRRLIASRLIDFLDEFNDEKLIIFGDKEDSEKIVNIKMDRSGLYLEMPYIDAKKHEILKWILLNEGLIKYYETERDVEKILVWHIDDIEEGTEFVYRIFTEYYNLKPDFRLIDYSLLETKKSGCFIATAAYGTPFAKEINVLKIWRDESLKTNMIGRFFVRTYYKTSPLIAEFISNKNSLKFIVRKAINPFVKYLRTKQR